jgi:nucleoside 2-deoxyribosyltransferase
VFCVPARVFGYSTDVVLMARSRRATVSARHTPCIYLAGPFTQHFDASADGGHGDAPPSANAWKRTLLDTEAQLTDRGWTCFLPHRDVSGWGLSSVEPSAVAIECLRAVRSSQVVLALPAHSFGTHVEVGFALGLGIGVVGVQEARQSHSFFAGALISSGVIQSITVESVTCLPTLIRDGALDELLESCVLKPLSGISRDV